MIDIGVEQLSFHYESEMHIDRLLKKIKRNGIKAGIALNPSTSINVLDYILDSCDFVLLMLINPGFAEDSDERQVPYAVKKVSDCSNYLRLQGCNIPFEIDGRISIDRIPYFICAGADTLVLGRTSLFEKGSNLAQNFQRIKAAVREGLERKPTYELS